MAMKTGRDWLLVESSKLQDRRQRNCVIRNVTVESGVELSSQRGYVDIFYHIRQVAACVVKLVLWDAFGTLIWGDKGGCRGSAMAPFERAMAVSYRLSIVTVALSLTIRPQFAIECLRRSNQQGWVTLWQNFGRTGLTDISQILKRLGKDMGLLYAKEIVSICSAF